MNDIHFEDNIDDKDNDDYFNMNVDSTITKLALVIEDGPYKLPNFQLSNTTLDSDNETNSLDSVEHSFDSDIK